MTIDGKFLLVNSARLSGDASISLLNVRTIEPDEKCREFHRKADRQKVT
jgi:hypothetical protein